MMKTGMAGVLATLGLAAVAAPAQALTMKVKVQSVYQYGNTAGVYLGHTVSAKTNMNRLLAGGSFVAKCLSPWTPDPITGERSLPAQAFIGGLDLTVTIPATLPALRNMPGWHSVPRGQTLYCTYTWTAYAKEGTYTIGVPGSSMPVGGAEVSESDQKSFTMSKPGTATGEDDACHP